MPQERVGEAKRQNTVQMYSKTMCKGEEQVQETAMNQVQSQYTVVAEVQSFPS